MQLYNPYHTFHVPNLWFSKNKNKFSHACESAVHHGACLMNAKWIIYSIFPIIQTFFPLFFFCAFHQSAFVLFFYFEVVLLNNLSIFQTGKVFRWTKVVCGRKPVKHYLYLSCSMCVCVCGSKGWRFFWICNRKLEHFRHYSLLLCSSSNTDRAKKMCLYFYLQFYWKCCSGEAKTKEESQKFGMR